jgi:hypothetical protein
MMQPPSIGATNGGLGFTVEFPFGDESSLCQVMGDQYSGGVTCRRVGC